MLKNSLALTTGIDIAFLSADAHLTIHQPKMCEIGMIGENDFRLGCQLLAFSHKEKLAAENPAFELKTDLEIFLLLLRNNSQSSFHIAVMQLLALLFPNYTFTFEKKSIGFKNINNPDEPISYINDDNFQDFQTLLKEMFCLNFEPKGSNSDYNPANSMAQKILDKINAGKKKLQALKNQSDSTSQNLHLYEDHIRILTVGLHKDKNIFKNYTVYQLEQEYIDFIGKENYDQYISAKLAGATKIEDVDYWMNLQSF